MCINQESAAVKLRYLAAAAALACPLPAGASELSTHILDLARGVGGADVPVVLMRRGDGGQWSEVARARTDANGRVRSFGDPKRFAPGLYKLHFDLSAYPAAGATPFFPEIDVTFRASDAAAHYHVPVVVSPFGYSTYRGN
ncbi:MAG: hydroxyisourate hydrolase [Sphingomonas sp.]|nr:MAG: hydroxyisourate hydrolase [Sphingomonas sp.]